MPTNLNISRITRVALYDTAWTAGVEYALQSQEDIEDKADTDFDHKSEDEKIWMQPTMKLTPQNWMKSTKTKPIQAKSKIR